MCKITVLLTLIVILSFSSSAFCELPFDLVVENAIRIDIQEEEDSIYLGRVGLEFEEVAEFCRRQVIFKVLGEVRHSLEENRSFGEKLGLEVGVPIYDWLYFGTQLNYVFSLRDHGVSPILDDVHLQANVVITPDWSYELPKGELKLRLIEEYTYNISEGEGFRNEVAAFLDWEVNEWLTVPVGWRHIDRIHYYDSDQIELGAIITF